MPSDRKLRLFAQACEVSFYTTRQPRKWLSDLEASHPGSSPLRDAECWAHEMRHHARPIRANLLREIIGNPFRPVRRFGSAVCNEKMKELFEVTSTVLDLARHAYDSRDFAGLPILADALEEAGCDSEHLLRHLRGKELVPSPHMPKIGLWQPQRSPHVRGCWALDLILGKE